MPSPEATRAHNGLKTVMKDLSTALGGSRWEVRNGYLFLVNVHVPLPGFNGLWVEGPEDAAIADLPASIAEVEAFGLPCGLRCSAGRMPVVAAEARRLGLASEAQLPLLTATPGDLERAEAPGLHIEVVADDAGLREALAVSAAAFGIRPSALAALYSPVLARQTGLRTYLGRIAGEPVTTAMGWLTSSGPDPGWAAAPPGSRSVGILQVATHPAHRNQGFASAVATSAALDGFDAGADLAWLQAAGATTSLYGRLGFRQVERYLLLSRPPAVPTVAASRPGVDKNALPRTRWNRRPHR